MNGTIGTHPTCGTTDKSDKLLSLARTMFGVLTETETKLFTVVAQGEHADYSNVGPKDRTQPEMVYTTDKIDHPSNYLKWGDGRILKAEHLRWLFTDPEAVALIDCSGVWIRGAQIQNRLDLVSSKISFPLVFENCVFLEDMDFGQAEIQGLYLLGSHIKAIQGQNLKVTTNLMFAFGFRAEGEVNLIDASVGGFLDCSGGQFINPVRTDLSADANQSQRRGIALTLQCISVEGSVYLRSYFANTGSMGSQPFKVPFVAQGVVDLIGATIGGYLDCGQGEFRNPTLVAKSTEGQMTQLGGVALNGDRLKVEQSVALNNNFLADGCVCLTGAYVGGSLDCQDGQFENSVTVVVNADGQKMQFGGTALMASRLKVEGDVFLRNNFTCKGEVCMAGAEVQGSLDCFAGQFINPVIADFNADGTMAQFGGTAISAYGLKVDGNVFLRGMFRLEGELNMMGATVGGNVECSTGQIINPLVIKQDTKGKKIQVGGTALSAHGLKVAGDVIFSDGFSARGSVFLVSVSFDRILYWTSKVVLEDLKLDLRFAKVNTLEDNKESWPQKGKLFLSGFVYDQISQKSPTDAKTRIDWLQRQPDDQFLPQPYEQLASVLRNQGLEDESEAILIAKNKDRARQIERFRKGWMWYHLVGPLVGFGYRPWRAFWISLAIILINACVFYEGYKNDLMIPTKSEAYRMDSNSNTRSLSDDYPPFSPVAFSLESFLPLVHLGQTDCWVPNANSGYNVIAIRNYKMTSGAALRAWLWIHVLLGWTLTSLWIGALSGVVKSRS